MLFLNQFLSKGARVFAVCKVSLILCAGKCIQLFTGTLLAFKLYFQQVVLSLQQAQSNPIRKRVKFWSRSNVKILLLYCICT
jgi:hypothetical protein